MDKGTNTTRIATIVCAVSLMIVGTTGLAGPASADDPIGVMPDINGGSLQAAVDAIPAGADGVQLAVLQPWESAPTDPPANMIYLHTTEKTAYPEVVYNFANWDVCGQSPKSGAKYKKTTNLLVSIARPGKC